MPVKLGGYREPTDYPIPVAAVDPLDGEFLYGEDKQDEIFQHQEVDPDELLESAEEEAEKQEKTKKASLVKLNVTARQVELLARKLDPTLPIESPRLRRYVARVQSAMKLGMDAAELHQVFYKNRYLVDPIRLAGLGYEAEARFLHPAHSMQQSAPQTTEQSAVEQMSAVPSDPVTARRKILAGCQEVDWVEKLAQEQTGLKIGDEIEDDKGQRGRVESIDQATGNVVVDYGTSPVPKATYMQDALDQGKIKRAVTKPFNEIKPGDKIQYEGRERMVDEVLADGNEPEIVLDDGEVINEKVYMQADTVVNQQNEPGSFESDMDDDDSDLSLTECASCGGSGQDETGELCEDCGGLGSKDVW